MEPASGDLPRCGSGEWWTGWTPCRTDAGECSNTSPGRRPAGDDAFLQARLYARLAGADAPAEVAVPFFRDRVWGVPDKPEELDARIRAVRDGLAEGAFPVPADPKEIKPFDWPLAIRPDLLEDAPRHTPTPTPTAPTVPPPSATRPPTAVHRPADHADREAAADPARHGGAPRLGGDRQDDRPHPALPEPRAGGRPAPEHPRAHLHPEGGGGDEGPDPAGAPGSGDPRQPRPRGSRGLHPRRLQPRPDPRVPPRRGGRAGGGGARRAGDAGRAAGGHRAGPHRRHRVRPPDAGRTPPPREEPGPASTNSRRPTSTTG